MKIQATVHTAEDCGDSFKIVAQGKAIGAADWSPFLSITINTPNTERAPNRSPVMQWVDLDVGSPCWCFVGNHKGKMSKGKVAAIVRIPGYARPHYIVEIPTSVDPLLEVRDGFSVSDSARKAIGFLRHPNQESSDA